MRLPGRGSGYRKNLGLMIGPCPAFNTLPPGRPREPLRFLRFSPSPEPEAGLLDFEHPIQRHFGPVLHIVSHFDLVNHVAFDQILQHPA